MMQDEFHRREDDLDQVCREVSVVHQESAAVTRAPPELLRLLDLKPPQLVRPCRGVFAARPKRDAIGIQGSHEAVRSRADKPRSTLRDLRPRSKATSNSISNRACAESNFRSRYA